jgi:hypothetical protein
VYGLGGDFRAKGKRAASVLCFSGFSLGFIFFMRGYSLIIFWVFILDANIL